METYLVYFDETGDDGANTLSSKQFVLTSVYLDINRWQDTFNDIRAFRKELKEKYGLHHTISFWRIPECTNQGFG